MEGKPLRKILALLLLVGGVAFTFWLDGLSDRPRRRWRDHRPPMNTALVVMAPFALAAYFVAKGTSWEKTRLSNKAIDILVPALVFGPVLVVILGGIWYSTRR